MKKRTIKVTQDVYDRLNQSFFPKENNQEPEATPDSFETASLVVDNGPMELEVISGEGKIKIEGEVTEKELRQLADFFSPGKLIHQYTTQTQYGEEQDGK